MNASIPTLDIRNPLTSPAASPAASATSIPASTSGTPMPSAGIIAFIAMIITPATKAAMDPTDRSMPPAVMTKVMPTAMMPMKADRASTFVTLPALRKLEFSDAPRMISAIRASRGPSACSGRRRRGLAAGVAVSVMPRLRSFLLRPWHGAGWRLR